MTQQTDSPKTWNAVVDMLAHLHGAQERWCMLFTARYDTVSRLRILHASTCQQLEMQRKCRISCNKAENLLRKEAHLITVVWAVRISQDSLRYLRCRYMPGASSASTASKPSSPSSSRYCLLLKISWCCLGFWPPTTSSMTKPRAHTSEPKRGL